MALLEHVPVGAMDLHRFESVLSPLEYQGLLELIDQGARELEGRVIWNVNSTSRGGGVVELLRPLLGYSRGGGVDARWAVIAGRPEFFELTKRIHNHLHGFDGDGGSLSTREAALYEQTLAANTAELVRMVRPLDVVILHDPQTAGMVSAVKRAGATVIWRCHVGLDHPNELAREAWRFLLPYVVDADAYVFSRASFGWEELDQDKIAVIPPSIDAFSPKNAGQSTGRSLAILSSAGIVRSRTSAEPTFTRSDGTPGRVDSHATMLEEAPLSADDNLVVQVSRWDALKDPLGVIRAFADHIVLDSDAHLVLAGPAVDSVADDPEGEMVLRSVNDAWRGLPDWTRARVHLASIPMVDLEENAAIVNSLQRHATVVVQKSIAEGFGLVVAEAMWKERPVVASGIGGIQDQIVDGESGILIADPRDLPSFGAAVTWLLSNPQRAQTIGHAGHERIREHFLAPHHLSRYFELIQGLLSARALALASTTESGAAQ